MSETSTGGQSPELTKPDTIQLVDPAKRGRGEFFRVNIERDSGSIITPESIGIAHELSTGQKVDVLGMVDNGGKQLAVMRIENPDGGDPNNQVYLVIGGLSPEDGKLADGRMFAIPAGKQLVIGANRDHENGRLNAEDLWGPEAAALTEDALAVELAGWAGTKAQASGGVGIENLSKKGATVTARILASRADPNQIYAPDAKGVAGVPAASKVSAVDYPVLEQVEPQPAIAQAIPQAEIAALKTPLAIDAAPLPVLDEVLPELNPKLDSDRPHEVEPPVLPALDLDPEEDAQNEVAEPEEVEEPALPEQKTPSMQEVFSSAANLAEAMRNPEAGYEFHAGLRRVVEAWTAAQTNKDVEAAWDEIAPRLRQSLDQALTGYAVVTEIENHLNQLSYSYSVLAHNIEEARTEEDWMRVTALGHQAEQISEDLEASIQRARVYDEDLRRTVPSLGAMEEDHRMALRRASYALNSNEPPDHETLEQICKEWQSNNDPDLGAMASRLERSVGESSLTQWRSRVTALDELTRTTASLTSHSDFDQAFVFTRNKRDSVSDLVRFAVTYKTSRDSYDIRSGANIPGLADQIQAIRNLLNALNQVQI